MTVEHVVLLAQVELTTSSVLRVTENAVAANLTVIDPSTGSALASTKNFYLRGDGSDDDLLQVLVETVQSHAQANTYTAAITWSTDPSAAAGTVTITRASGANNFQINWSHASTTIESTWFGFTDADTANDGNPKSGTLSPLVAWVSPEAPEVCGEHPEYDTSVARARSGRVRGLNRGGPYHILDLSFALCDSRRVLRPDNTSDPAATFASFLEQVGDGTSFEVHQQTITGSAVDALTVYSRRREYWRFDEETSAAFRPARREPGLALYAWDLVAHGYGETTPPAATPVIDGLTYWGASDQADTYLTSAGSHLVLPDQSTFTWDNAGDDMTTCLECRNPATEQDPLNGKNGIRITSASSIKERTNASTTATGSAVRSDRLYGTGTAHTAMFLAKFPATLPGSFLDIVLMQFNANDVRIWDAAADTVSKRSDVSTDATLFTTDDAPHLIAITRSANDWAIYVDDMVTPVTTWTSAVTTNADPGWQHPNGNLITMYEMMTYDRVLDAGELATNLAYLSSDARWGAW